MDGATHWLQTRATHLRISKDLSSNGFKYTTSRRSQKLHSINNRATASSALLRAGNSNVPEIRTRLQNLKSVKKAFGILINFSHHARARGFPDVTILLAAQSKFLAGSQPLGEPQYATVLTDQHSCGGALERSPVVAEPRRLHRHSEIYTITLPEPIRAHL